MSVALPRSQTPPRIARRGACPGLSSPMSTGDGLLVRFLPVDTLPLGALDALCAAAKRFGNGIIEITSRGSVQLRGFTASSAVEFAARIAALGNAGEDGIPVLCDPLAGLGEGALFDAPSFARVLRPALAPFAAKLSAKLSVAIDGGGPLSLDELAADIRVRATRCDDHVALLLGVGGDAMNAVAIGVVPVAAGIVAVTRLLDVLARHGRDIRARDLLERHGVAPFRAAIAPYALPHLVPGREVRRRANNALSVHELAGGRLARGIGPAFGHTDAERFSGLIAAAARAGAVGFRTAPGRVLLAVGVRRDALPAFERAADGLGFITAPDDIRRRIVACAGAPICASGLIEARALAPAIVEKVGPCAAGDLAFPSVHLSGCAKGCAHAGRASLTVVGTAEGCALVADGSPRDRAFATIKPADLPASVARFFAERKTGGAA
jgi:precorrin-3B synthase